MESSKFEVLDCEHSRLGLLCLRRRELLSRPGTIVTEVTLNHEFLMSSYITDSERALARLALNQHEGQALRILVGGLGLGYTCQEALLCDRVADIEVIEYLPQVIAWLENGLIPLAGALQADPRLRVVEGDVFARLSTAPSRQYDLILIDVDHSPDEHLGAGNSSFFYTEAGLRLARRHLASGGILGIWSYAEHSAFLDALRRVFGDVRVDAVTVMNDLVDEEQTDWLFFARAN